MQLVHVTLSAGIGTKSRAALGLYHGTSGWLFICLAHQRLAFTLALPCEDGSEKTFSGPSGQEVAHVRGVSHCATEILCTELPCNIMVNLKPLLSSEKTS